MGYKRVFILVILGLIALVLLTGVILLDEGIITSYLAPFLKTTNKEAEETNIDAFLNRFTTDDLAKILPYNSVDQQEFQRAMQASSVAILSPVIQELEYTHVPIAFNSYPRPAGYRTEIAQRVKAADPLRYEDTVRNLVQNYSPRSPDQYQVFVDLQICNPGGTRFEKSNLQRVLEYARVTLETLGYRVYIEQIKPSIADYNIIAEKPASAGSTFEQVIEIGAHIDSATTTPGASRNATGLAGILEMAYVLRNYPNQHPWQFVIFVEFGAEKLGSQSHLQNIAGQPIKTALILDGIGWSEIETGFMNCISANQEIPYTLDLANIFDAVREPYEIDINWRQCNIEGGFSSETRYWDAGIPAVLSVGGLPYNNPTLDKCSDNMASVNLDNAFRIVKQNIAVLLTLDSEP
jgi:hypothetical protein